MSRRPNWGEGYSRQVWLASERRFPNSHTHHSLLPEAKDGAGNRSNQGGSVLQGARAQQQGRGGAQNWGSGFNRGGVQNQNRFSALAETEQEQRLSRQQQNQGGGWPRGSQGKGRSQAERSDVRQHVDWRRAVEHDNANEKPHWPLTCYSHIRSQQGSVGGGGPNDVTGDYQFEELRWAQMQAGARGVTAHLLVQEFSAAVHAQQQQLMALSRARKPPAEGGPPIPPLEAFLPALHSLLHHSSVARPSAGNLPATFGAPPATPFGQVVGAFGRNPSVAAHPSAFGHAANTRNPATVTRAGFGQHGGGTVFGSGFGQQKQQQPDKSAGTIHFGQQAAQPQQSPQASPFGPSPAAVPRPGSFSPFAPGSPAPIAPAAHPSLSGSISQSSMFGTPSPAAPGSGQAMLTGMTPFGQPVNSQSPVPPEGVEASKSDTVEDPWAAATFEPGRIPDAAPPACYCVD